MRMWGPGAPVLLLLGLVSWSRGQETIKKLSGSDVTFKVDVTARPSEIVWFQGTNKIVDLEEGAEPLFYSLTDRTVPNLKEGTLLLKNVSPVDNGSYRAQLLIGGSYSNTNFILQVYDHVCQVVIQNSTTENNVTLRCTCSAPSAAPPARYWWYNESSGRHVSELQNITVQREEEEQRLQCNASNAVSWTDATITVPPRGNGGRLHEAIICAVIVVIFAIIIVVVIFMCKKSKSRTFSVRNRGEEAEKLLPERIGESLTPSEINCMKAGEPLMSIQPQSPLSCLERLSVQQDMLKIIDVKEEDYTHYMAKVHCGENTTTHKFLCTSAQNGEIGQHGAETEVIYPENGELKMKIPNAENAERIVWSKDGAEILEVTCDPASCNGLVFYKGALSTGLVSDRDKTRWEDVARPDAACVQYVFRLEDAAVKSGSVTLYPVIVGNEKQITWTKDGEELATWREGESPGYSRGEALYLESGRLTLRDLQQHGSGQYTMEARGPQTAKQHFILTIQPVTGS